MKYSFSLISKLYSLSIIWLVLCIIFILMSIVGILNPNNEYIFKCSKSSWGINNNFYGGYSLPVRMSIQLPQDTIVQYKIGTQMNELWISNYNKEFRDQKKIDFVLKTDSISKKFYFSKWRVLPNFNDINTNNSNDGLVSYSDIDSFPDKQIFDQELAMQSKEIVVSVKPTYSLETTLNFKVKGWYKNIVLSFSLLLLFFVTLFVSYQFYVVIKNLYNKISFMNTLYKRLYKVGLVLVLMEIYNFFIAFFYSNWYGNVSLIQASNIEEYKKQIVTINFNPTSNADFSTFLLGLCIIVLSYIFEYGNRIEHENALTV